MRLAGRRAVVVMLSLLGARVIQTVRLSFANETDRRKQLGYGRRKEGYIWVEACRRGGNEAVV